MRRLVEYSLLKYYPSPKTDEFFNVGVFFHNQNKLKVISSEHLVKLCLNKHEKESIRKMLAMFDASILEQKWYSNHLHISEPHRIRTSCSEGELESILYYDHIGYKFDAKKAEHKDKKSLLKETAFSIIEKEFKQKIKIKEDSYVDFVLGLENKQIPFIVGSLLNDADTAKAFKSVIHLNGCVYFGRTNENIELEHNEQKSTKIISLLGVMPVKIEPFYNEDAIYGTFKSLITL